MLNHARKLQPELSRLRRTIHRQPELLFDVTQTAALVSRTLSDLGVEHRTGVGKSGVVAWLGQNDGPVVAVRADMDALPIREENTTDYASQVAGKMHACGHDAHTAMLLGVAMLLREADLPGQVRLLFQPAEEGVDDEGLSGASRMIADGALDGVDAAIALHVDGTKSTGTIGMVSGPAQAAVDDFFITIRGQGGHAAYPHRANDPIWLASQVLNTLYAIPSRRIQPTRAAVVTVGIIEGGSATNVIPDTVRLAGTLRSYDDDVREQLVEEVRIAARAIETQGAVAEVVIVRGYPSALHDPAVAELIVNTALDTIGPESIAPSEATMGAEDFAFMTRKIPAAMFTLGTRGPDDPVRYLHTPTFDIDENALPVGSAMLAQAAINLLRQRHDRQRE